MNFEERETEKFRVLDKKGTLLGKAEKKKVEKRIIDTRRTNALLMQAWKWADLEDEKNTIKYDKRSRPMKFCVIRTRRRHVVFTFIACVCLEGIGAHIHSKVLVVVLY